MLLAYYKILLKINLNELYPVIFNTGIQFVQQKYIIRTNKMCDI